MAELNVHRVVLQNKFIHVHGTVFENNGWHADVMSRKTWINDLPIWPGTDPLTCHCESDTNCRWWSPGIVPIYTASAHNLAARSQTGNKRCCYHQIKFDHCGKNWMDRRIQPSPMCSTYWINRNLPLWDLKQHLEVSSGKINLLIPPLVQRTVWFKLIHCFSTKVYRCLWICMAHTGILL